MKMGICLVCLTVFMAVMTSTRVSAQSGCTNVLISLSPCLNYITGNSTSPSQQCCRQLGSVVQSSPDCLCQVLNGGGSQLGINVNQTQALGLPKACNVQTPPVSRCSTGGGGGGSTSDSPAESPNSSGPGNGSKTVPAGEGDGPSSDGSSIKFSFPLLAILSAASYIAIF
ncbi:PREDICTED: non-specific lipid-transfer protein-like protein At2g13820 [Camelina sativa]|uniref:Non-specific lipid-transfer protein-like protein At2g13820 n=1 Tax=Camelina sativa TaxID=90675 RepID=A0ABM0W6W8_CAMSA|nr:PREDICTED: non-specific lipid-transfer protein-like protein At2g13820 [Camelina sativa]